MTVAIGFIHRSKTPKLVWGELPRIILASDSQATYGATKRDNPNKISTIDFANGSILAAQAGSVEVGDKVIEILRRKALGKMMESEETAINIAKEALMEVRSHLREWNVDCVTDWIRFYWEEHNLDLLLGYFFDGQPQLWKTNIAHGIFTRVNSFEAIGAGKEIGYFLLKQFARAAPNFEYGWAIAASVVNQVIENVDGCGAPTWAGHVIPIPKGMPHASYFPIEPECCAAIFPRVDTDMISQEMKLWGAKNSMMRERELLRMMKRVHIKAAAVYKKWQKLRTKRK